MHFNVILTPMLYLIFTRQGWYLDSIRSYFVLISDMINHFSSNSHYIYKMHLVRRKVVRAIFCSNANPKVPDYYELFNLEANFTDAQLKSSYLELVKKYHPDLSLEDDSEDIFKMVQDGYAILSNPQERAKYRKTILQNKPVFSEQTSKRSQDFKDKFYNNFSMKQTLGTDDTHHFSYNLFKKHYQEVEIPKSEYIKYEGQGQQYYEHPKKHLPQSWPRQLAFFGGVIGVFGLAYWMVHGK